MNHNQKCAAFATTFACLCLIALGMDAFMMPTMAEYASVTLVLLLASTLGGLAVLCAHECVTWIGRIDA